MLNLLARFFAGPRTVPPGEWPISTITEPPRFNSSRRAFGPLRFGDALESASAFGRPDHFLKSEDDYWELIYAQAGFQIDFDADRLAYIAYFIAPDACLPKAAPITFSQPVIDSHRLSSTTSPEHVETLFGPPKSREEEENELVLSYDENGLTMEFEFTSTTSLKRLNIYPAESQS